MKSLVALALVLSTGCATLFNEKGYNVTTAQGVTVNGQDRAFIANKQDHVVTFEGGRTCEIESGVAWYWVVLDLFTTGPIGLVVDGVTGNWKELDPEDDCAGAFTSIESQK